MNVTLLPPRRRAALLTAILCLAGSFAPAQAEPTNAPATRPIPRRPNIILIMADDLNASDLGSYGQREIKTPHLDQLAADGMRFTSFYAGSPEASQSRQTFLLGRHAGHLPVPATADLTSSNQPSALPTVAELLRQAGYHTGCIGEWGAPGFPQKQGFIDWAGLLTEKEARMPYPHYISRFDPVTGYDGPMEFTGNFGTTGDNAASDIFTAAAKNFIKLNKPDKFNQQRPFFLFLGYNSPRAALTDSAIPEADRAAAVAQLDANIGLILDALKTYKQESNTVLIITSDNTPRAPRPTPTIDPKARKQSGPPPTETTGLSEADLRVPLIINFPGHVIANNLSDLPWAAWDLLPTLATIGYTTSPKNLDGISLWPLLTGQPQTNRHEFLYWELRDNQGLHQAARMGEWKAIKSASDKPAALYNLKTDAAQKTNLAQENAEPLGKLEAYLKQFQP